MSAHKPIAKLTAAQRTALESIAADGVTLHVGSWNGRAWIEGPTAAKPIVVNRLVDAGLVNSARRPQAGFGPHVYDLSVTPRGRDALAGVTRAPLKAHVVIHIDGHRVHSVDVLVDPYDWESWDEDERERRRVRTAEIVIARHVTATVHVEDEPAEAISHTRRDTPADPGHTGGTE